MGFPYLYLSKLIKKRNPQEYNSSLYLLSIYSVRGSVLNALYAVSHLVLTKFYGAFILLLRVRKH